MTKNKGSFNALIAAAGLSVRMGTPKALRPIKDETAAFYLASLCQVAHISKVLVTLPDFFIEGLDLRNDLKLIQAKVINNLFPEHGYAGSIMSAVKHVDESCQGLLIMPIDFIASKALLIAMTNLAKSNCGRPLIIVPYYHELAGHPVYLSRDFFEELHVIHRYEGLNNLIKAHAHNVMRLGYFDKRIVLNMNERFLKISSA